MTATALGFGFKMGHWSDPEAATGCTAILPPLPNVTSCDIRGASPGSRELEQLHPDRRLTEVHGILLTGGSAFGLAAATGVVEYLEERGIGYKTSVAKVPIVPAAVIFDLASGRADARPRAEHGRAACEAATEAPIPSGRVGAGTGATVGKWAGLEHASPGGLGIGFAEDRGQRAAAVAVVNAVGDVIASDGSVIAGTKSPDAQPSPLSQEQSLPLSTVLAVVAVEAEIDKRDVRWLAARGSDGITTSIRPAHTRYDGDVVFAVAARPQEGRSEADLDTLGVLVTRAVAAAIRNAVE